MQPGAAPGCRDSLVILEAAQPLAALVRDAWGSYDGFVFIMAVGIVVRLVAPLLAEQVV